MAATLKRLVGNAGAGIDESHGTDRLYDVLSNLATAQNAMIAAFNTHTHGADGSEAGAYNTSQPQSDAEDIAQTTAVSVTALITIES